MNMSTCNFICLRRFLLVFQLPVRQIYCSPRHRRGDILIKYCSLKGNSNIYVQFIILEFPYREHLFSIFLPPGDAGGYNRKPLQGSFFYFNLTDGLSPYSITAGLPLFKIDNLPASITNSL